MKGHSDHDAYTRWKTIVPVLYDWLANYHLMWPSLSCRWGPQVEHGTYRNRQRLYMSEQTDGSMPNTLVVATCEVVKPRTAAAKHISQFNVESKSSFVKKSKAIIHPGEVNRIRELPQNSKIVATHTDSPEVYIWNTDTQPNRASAAGAQPSRPDLVLVGHTDDAEFALACSPLQPLVISGGKDQAVVLWGISDHIAKATAAAASAPPTGRQSWNSGGQGCPERNRGSSRVDARGVFKGHTATVEDVQFRPSNPDEFCSVGDDSCLIVWDVRAGSEPAIKVEKAHDADLHSVDWNAIDENLLLTGSVDASVRLFDLRKLSGSGFGVPIQRFEGHTAAVLCVQWCPDKSSVFGSCAEDGVLNVWDHEKVTAASRDSGNLSKRFSNPAPGLFFQHVGHRDKVVDFHWNYEDPWTLASVSDDGHNIGGGGTLQVWRMSDFIYRAESEVLEELERIHPQV